MRGLPDGSAFIVPNDGTIGYVPILVPAVGALGMSAVDGEVGAILKDPISHGGHAVGNDDRGEVCTT